MFHNIEVLSDNFIIRDLGFYNPKSKKVSKINSRFSTGFPLVSSAYRIANVILPKSSPIITFRLMSMDEVCICNELFLQIICLDNDSVYCSLIGNDRFSRDTKYFGDVTMDRKDIQNGSPLNVTLNKLTSRNILLEESRDLVHKYLYEGVLHNKVSVEIKDSILYNSNFYS